MDWDQIESKWAAMTRRVRADVQYSRLMPGGRLVRKTTDDVLATAILSRNAAARADGRKATPQE